MKKNVKVKSKKLRESINKIEKYSFAKSLQEISKISLLDDKGEIKSSKFINFNFKTRLYELYNPSNINKFLLKKMENKRSLSIFNKTINFSFNKTKNFSFNKNIGSKKNKLSLYDFSANSENSTKSLNIKKLGRNNNFENFDFEEYFNMNFESQIIFLPNKKMTKIKFKEKKNFNNLKSRYSLNINNNKFFDKKNYFEKKFLNQNLNNLIKKKYRISSESNYIKNTFKNSNGCDYIKKGYKNMLSHQDIIQNKYKNLNKKKFVEKNI